MQGSGGAPPAADKVLVYERSNEICFYRVFALGNKQSVLSIEDLLLPGVVYTYTITDVYITARNQ